MNERQILWASNPDGEPCVVMQYFDLEGNVTSDLKQAVALMAVDAEQQMHIFDIESDTFNVRLQ